MTRDSLEITINRRRFGAAEGVLPVMTAANIAGLAGVPADNAIVEREIARNTYEPVTGEIPIAMKSGMHFLVTRHFVMGG